MPFDDLGMDAPTTKPCPFFHFDPKRVLAEDEPTVTCKYDFPVSQGHTVIILRRHCAALFETSDAEQAALLKAVGRPRTSWTNTVSRMATTSGLTTAKLEGRLCYVCTFI